MISFMIGVLGSTLFWIFYTVLSLCMSMVVIKMLGCRSSTYIIFTTGHKSTPLKRGTGDQAFHPKTAGDDPIDNISRVWAVIAVLFCAVIWPVVMGVYLPFKITKLVFTGVLFRVFSIFFGKIPSVNIKFKEQEE